MRAALIVGDAHSRTPLAAVRALGRAGWRVGLGSPAPHRYITASRWLSAWHPVAPPWSPRFADDVRAAVGARRYDVVFPAGDAELLALSADRAAVGAVVPYPSHDVVVRALDKLELTGTAAAAGLAVPWTARVAEVGDDELDRPLMVKARLHWTPGAGEAQSRLEVLATDSARQVRRRAAQIAAAGGDAVVQERLAGLLTGYVFVADSDSRVVAAVQQRAERIFPVAGGPSSRAVTVPVDRTLATAVQRLVADLGWTGLAELQLIERGAEPPALIDFNGRFYGSMALALAAGVDVATLWAGLAVGERPVPLPQARPGVRFSALALDLRRAMTERRGGLARDVAETLSSARGAVHAVWDPADPRPAIRLLRSALTDRVLAPARRG